jgi:peptidoglycan-N-acetylglucosamine deacetylase
LFSVFGCVEPSNGLAPATVRCHSPSKYEELRSAVARHQCRLIQDSDGLMSMRAGLAGFIALMTGLAAPVAQAADCPGNPKALGLSRVQEIDTKSGPRFGQQQYKDNDFLDDGEVVLTFDDGPSRAYTQAVVSALAAHCTKATFFMVGERALQDPAMVREVAARGHTVGTHTWSHENLRKAGQNGRREIELGVSAVSQALGRPVAPFFRFPYLADTGAMMSHLQSRQVGNFSIDIDAYDYRTQDPGEVHRRIMDELGSKRKGILLFHDIQPSTARALPGLLAAMKAQGFRVVHMVPAAPVQTLAEFDAIARGGKPKQVAAAQPIEPAPPPLPQRSFTGQFPRPQSPPVFVTPPPAVAAPQPPAPFPVPPAFEPAPRPRIARPRQEPDWRDVIFAR